MFDVIQATATVYVFSVSILMLAAITRVAAARVPLACGVANRALAVFAVLAVAAYYVLATQQQPCSRPTILIRHAAEEESVRNQGMPRFVDADGPFAGLSSPRT
jgi:uncharacterized membrane protein